MTPYHERLTVRLREAAEEYRHGQHTGASDQRLVLLMNAAKALEDVSGNLAQARAERLVTLGRWSEAVVTALEADRSKAEATIATLREQLAGFAPYLKEGETPLERLTRERADNDALLTLLARAKGEVEAAQAKNATLRAALATAQAERDAARAEVAQLQAALSDARAVADMVSETARDRQ